MTQSLCTGARCQHTYKLGPADVPACIRQQGRGHLQGKPPLSRRQVLAWCHWSEGSATLSRSDCGPPPLHPCCGVRLRCAAAVCADRGCCVLRLRCAAVAWLQRVTVAWLQRVTVAWLQRVTVAWLRRVSAVCCASAPLYLLSQVVAMAQPRLY